LDAKEIDKATEFIFQIWIHAIPPFLNYNTLLPNQLMASSTLSLCQCFLTKWFLDWKSLHLPPCPRQSNSRKETQDDGRKIYMKRNTCGFTNMDKMMNVRARIGGGKQITNVKDATFILLSCIAIAHVLLRLHKSCFCESAAPTAIRWG
jgi:hypothetical protein